MPPACTEDKQPDKSQRQIYSIDNRTFWYKLRRLMKGLIVRGFLLVIYWPLWIHRS